MQTSAWCQAQAASGFAMGMDGTPAVTEHLQKTAYGAHLEGAAVSLSAVQLHMRSLTCSGGCPQLLWPRAVQKAIRLSTEQEQQMVGARRQLLAGLQRSRAQRQRLIGQLRPAAGDVPAEALASDILELVSPDTRCRQLTTCIANLTPHVMPPCLARNCASQFRATVHTATQHRDAI